MQILEEISAAVIAGNAKKVYALTETALKEGFDPQQFSMKV